MDLGPSQEPLFLLLMDGEDLALFIASEEGERGEGEDSFLSLRRSHQLALGSKRQTPNKVLCILPVTCSPVLCIPT